VGIAHENDSRTLVEEDKVVLLELGEDLHQGIARILSSNTFEKDITIVRDFFTGNLACRNGILVHTLNVATNQRGQDHLDHGEEM